MQPSGGQRAASEEAGSGPWGVAVSSSAAGGSLCRQPHVPHLKSLGCQMALLLVVDAFWGDRVGAASEPSSRGLPVCLCTDLDLTSSLLPAPESTATSLTSAQARCPSPRG